MALIRKMSAIQTWKILFLAKLLLYFLINSVFPFILNLWIQIRIQNTDPDPRTQIKADPGPHHWVKYIIGISGDKIQMVYPPGVWSLSAKLKLLRRCMHAFSSIYKLFKTTGTNKNNWTKVYKENSSMEYTIITIISYPYAVFL